MTLHRLSLALLASSLVACSKPKPTGTEAPPQPPAATAPTTSAPDVAAPTDATAPAEPDAAAAAPTAEPDAATAPTEDAAAPAGPSITRIHAISGGATGTLEARAAKVGWPGLDGVLAHFTRKVGDVTVEAIGVRGYGEMVIAWGAGKVGLVELKQTGNEALAGYWVLNDGDDRAGAQRVWMKGPPPPERAGRYTVDGANRDAATWYQGELVVTKVGDRFDLDWTIGSTHYLGAGLPTETGLVACWSEDKQPCTIALYTSDGAKPGVWTGKVAVGGQPGVGDEVLTADTGSGDASLAAPAPGGDLSAVECVHLCRDQGLCGWDAVEGKCSPRTDLDCERAKSCPGHRGCVSNGAACVTSSAAAADCKKPLYDGLVDDCAESGSCSSFDGRCIALGDDDCAPSLGCKVEGRCHVEADLCVAKSDADCQAAAACKDEHRCTAKGGGCWLAATAVDGCKDVCAARGDCALVDGVCRPGGADDCKASALCKKEGLCSSSPSGCVAGADADCVASAACKEKEACTPVSGTCRKANQTYCTAMCATGDGSAQLGLCTARGGRCVNPNPEE